MLTAISIALICIATIVFLRHRLLCYLRHFQAGGYCRTQFKNWLIANNIFDRKGSTIATIAAVTLELLHRSQMSPFITVIICLLGAIALIWLSLWEKDPYKAEDFPLQPSEQVKGIYHLALGLYSIAFALVVVGVYQLGAGDRMAYYWLVVILAIQSSPVWIFLASTIL
jgi:hypothetical protein